MPNINILLFSSDVRMSLLIVGCTFNLAASLIGVDKYPVNNPEGVFLSLKPTQDRANSLKTIRLPVDDFRKMPSQFTVKNSNEAQPSSQFITSLNYMVDPASKRYVDSNQICRSVCSFCMAVSSRRVSALCYPQCIQGGEEFTFCFTLWTYTKNKGQ